MIRQQACTRIIHAFMFWSGMAFTAFSDVFLPADLPLNIPNASYSTVSTIDVSMQGIIGDVNAYIDLDHADMGDLDIFLRKDDLTIQLFNQHGPGSRDIEGVTFDDEATQAINSAPVPFGHGAFQPTSQPQPGMESALNIFDGINAFGQWELLIVDTWPDSEDGQLLAWSLDITFSQTVFYPGDANRDGIINHSDAAVLAANWQQTGATWAMGDFNEDHIVDDIDATLLAANWQPAVTATTVVPEPAAILHALIVITVLIVASCASHIKTQA